MTPHQKSFAAWIAEFRQLCLDWHGVESDDTNGGTWVKYEFQTKFGKMHALVMLSDYEGQVKRGWVDIFMKFAHEVDAAKVAPHVWGDFNNYSGKWNFGYSGKENLEHSRNASLAELTRRLNHVEAKNETNLPVMAISGNRGG